MSNFKITIEKSRLKEYRLGDTIRVLFKEQFIPWYSSYPRFPPLPVRTFMIIAEEGENYTLTPDPSLPIKL